MPSKNDKTIKAYRFFIEAERNSRVFTVDDIARASGWSQGTVKTYRTKKWYRFVRDVEGGLCCEGLLDVSEDAFIRIHAQKTDLGGHLLRPRFTPRVDALIDKARESALLGVQVYNNPLVSFRTPGYIVHMIIAYTALFHAIFERDEVEYWYKHDDGSPKMIDGDLFAWDIGECVTKYYKGKMIDESENIKFFINIRNKVEHRFVPALDTTFSGKCQALLMNFEGILINEFGNYFVLGQNLVLALQLSVFSSEQQEVLRKIQSAEYDSIRKYSEDYDARLPQYITQSMKYSFRAFLIPKIGNHASSSDIAIEFIKYDPDNPEDVARYEKQVAFIREKQVQVADQGKLKASDVVRRVNEATDQGFNMSHHTNAWKLFKVRPRERKADGCDTKYCQYSEAFREFIYTEAWVALLIEKVRSETDFAEIKTYHQKIKDTAQQDR